MLSGITPAVGTSGAAQHKKSLHITILFIFAGASLLFLFLEGMTSPLNHDEDHYLAGAVMAKEHAIYQDFTYSAMPLHPVLMGAFLRAIPVEHPFLWFRIMSAGIGWLGGILLFLTLRAMTRNDGISVLFSSFFVFSSMVLGSTNGLISCHIPAITLAIGAAGALHAALVRRSESWAALSGFLFCAAAGFKLYYLLLLPEVLLILFLFRAEGEAPPRRLKLCLAYLLGTLPAGFPVLLVFFQDPYAFMFNNYFFHQYSTAWRVAIGETGRISLLSRIAYVVEKLAYTGNAAVVIAFVVTGVGLGWRKLGQAFKRRDSLPLVWLILALTATVGAMLPRPMNVHYLTFPLPFYLLLAGSLYGGLTEVWKLRLNKVSAACAIVVVAAGGGLLFQQGVGGLAPSQWTPIAVHREAQQIAAALAAHPEPRVVATLSPLLVVEAGLPFAERFSGGPFFFRLGDTVPVAVQERLGLVQKGHAVEYLEAEMPAAVLLGFEGEHEAEFLEFVTQHGYTAWPEKFYGRGQLYLRPN